MSVVMTSKNQNNSNSSSCNGSGECCVGDVTSQCSDDALVTSQCNDDALVACSVTSWLDTFRRETIRSFLVDIPDDVVDYLNRGGTVVSNNLHCAKYVSVGSSDESDADSSNASDGWLDCETEAEQRPQFAQFDAQIDAALSALGDGGAFVKLNWHAPLDARWLTLAHALRATHVDDVHLLLAASRRLLTDIHTAQRLTAQCVSGGGVGNSGVSGSGDDGGGGGDGGSRGGDEGSRGGDVCVGNGGGETEGGGGCDSDIGGGAGCGGAGRWRRLRPVLLLRQWCDISPGAEFRCFVVNQTLIAVCQREISQCFPFMKEDEKSIVQEIGDFFARSIRNRFPLSNYSFDVFCDTKTVATSGARTAHHCRVRLLDFGPLSATIAATAFSHTTSATATTTTSTNASSTSSATATDPLLFTWRQLAGRACLVCETELPAAATTATTFPTAITAAATATTSAATADVIDATVDTQPSLTTTRSSHTALAVPDSISGSSSCSNNNNSSSINNNNSSIVSGSTDNSSSINNNNSSSCGNNNNSSSINNNNSSNCGNNNNSSSINNNNSSINCGNNNNSSSSCGVARQMLCDHCRRHTQLPVFQCIVPGANPVQPGPYTADARPVDLNGQLGPHSQASALFEFMKLNRSNCSSSDSSGDDLSAGVS